MTASHEPDRPDPEPVTVHRLAQILSAGRPSSGCFIIGLTGAVAIGKTTLAAALQADLGLAAGAPRVELVATDGFLYPNAVLEERGLTLRKGFPESYDMAAFRRVLGELRRGPAQVPVYSHVTYDVDLVNLRQVERADIVIVEGLGFPVPAEPMVDVMIYLDADEDHVETWFVDRFLDLRRRAETDAASFYTRFLSLSEAGAAEFARDVWTRINLPNWREHIVNSRNTASLVLRKGRDHSLSLVRSPKL